MTGEQHLHAMHVALSGVCIHETLKDYDRRNDAVIEALYHARSAGIAAGIRFDPKESEWPVVFIELETGQVSWHIEQHPNAWDGHDTDKKYCRLKEYLEDYL